MAAPTRIPLKKFNPEYWDKIRMKPSMTSISGKSPRLDLPVNPLAGVTDSNGATAPGKLGSLQSSGFDLGSAGKLAGEVIPYISNVVNSFRKPPRIKLPEMIGKTAPVRVNFDNQRNEVDRKVAGLNKNFDKTLDENTGAALKMGTLAAGLREKNSVSAAEATTNAGLATDANRQNLQVDMINSGLKSKYNDDVVSRELADTRFKQQNLADVSDKYMAQQGQRDAAALDLKKLAVMKTIWQNSGVYNRLMEDLKKKDGDPLGVGDFAKAFGGRIKPYAEGGELGGEGYKVTVTDIDRKAAAKDSFTSRMFKDDAASIYAMGLRPTTGADNSVMYMPNNDVFQTEEGNKMAFRYNKDNKFDVVHIDKNGTINQFDDKSNGELRGLDQKGLMNYVSQMYNKRAQKTWTQPSMEAQTSIGRNPNSQYRSRIKLSN